MSPGKPSVVMSIWRGTQGGGPVKAGLSVKGPFVGVAVAVRVGRLVGEPVGAVVGEFGGI